MGSLKNMPVAGVIVIIAIIILFILALGMLFYVCSRYRSITGRISKKQHSDFLHSVSQEAVMGPEFGRQICKVILVPPALHRDFQSTAQLVPVTHSVQLKCTVKHHSH